MLERPDLHDDLILSRLQDEYGLPASRVEFLPLGYDVNAAVYRVLAGDGTAYFLKLRKGVFEEITVSLPLFLRAQGIRSIIPILETRARQRWGSLGAYKMILYPFIEGKNGYEAGLSDRQWVDFGKALKAIHAAQVPPDLGRLIQQEIYSPQWRESVKAFQALVEEYIF